jgi:hypothetical protein
MKRSIPAWMRIVATALVLGAATVPIGLAHADDIPVPAELQATLLAKVAAYDRNLASRSGERVHILLVGKPSDPTSMPFVRQMSQALSGLETFAKLPHDEEIVEYEGPEELAQKCRSSSASVVYVGPGFHSDIEPIRAVLESTSVLTVSANPEDVPRGIVLGFDLISGKPKLVLHLGQSRKQRVDLMADVLKLMRIVD